MAAPGSWEPGRTSAARPPRSRRRQLAGSGSDDRAGPSPAERAAIEPEPFAFLAARWPRVMVTDVGRVLMNPAGRVWEKPALSTRGGAGNWGRGRQLTGHGPPLLFGRRSCIEPASSINPKTRPDRRRCRARLRSFGRRGVHAFRRSNELETTSGAEGRREGAACEPPRWNRDPHRSAAGRAATRPITVTVQLAHEGRKVPKTPVAPMTIHTLRIAAIGPPGWAQTMKNEGKENSAGRPRSDLLIDDERSRRLSAKSDDDHWGGGTRGPFARRARRSRRLQQQARSKSDGVDAVSRTRPMANVEGVGATDRRGC